MILSDSILPLFQILLKPAIAALVLPLMLVSCNKKKAGEEGQITEAFQEGLEEAAESEESADNFYSPAEDNAFWVEALLARVEEERIAEELARMEESLSEYQLENMPEEDASQTAEDTEDAAPEEVDPIEKFFEEAQEGRVISGKNNELRFYEFQNETLSPQVTDKGYTVVHSSNENVQRYFYDLQYHLIKKEEWVIRSASDAKITRTEKYIYSEESGKVIEKNITRENHFESIAYNKDSLPVSLKAYEIKDDKRYIVSERSWKYDDKNQLIKDEQKEYKYKNEDYSGEAESFVRRYEYTYYDTPAVEEKTEESGSAKKSEKSEKSEIPPDLKYYENNVLKMQYNYTDKKGTYYTWVYFDESFSVKTFYEDNIKVLEEFYNNKRLVRTKAYDKMD